MASDTRTRSAAGARKAPAAGPRGWQGRLRSRGTGALPLLLVLLVAVAVAAGSLAAGLTGASPQGWTTVWEDDFDGAAGSLPSSEDWLVDVGTEYPGSGVANWGTGEIQTYTADPANLSLDGEGSLRITPTLDESGAWRSGRIETRRSDFAPPQGGMLEVESRLRLPEGGRGYWAAFWMLGAPYRGNYHNWPGVGEIDILEQIGSEPDRMHGTIHCGVIDGGPCNEKTGIGGS